MLRRGLRSIQEVGFSVPFVLVAVCSIFFFIACICPISISLRLAFKVIGSIEHLGESWCNTIEFLSHETEYWSGQWCRRSYDEDCSFDAMKITIRVYLENMHQVVLTYSKFQLVLPPLMMLCQPLFPCYFCKLTRWIVNVRDCLSQSNHLI